MRCPPEVVRAGVRPASARRSAPSGDTRTGSNPVRHVPAGGGAAVYRRRHEQADRRRGPGAARSCLVGAVTSARSSGLGIGLAAAPAGATSCAGGGSIARSIDEPATSCSWARSCRRRTGARWATFAVEEVWSGDVPRHQVVKAGLPPERDAEPVLRHGRGAHLRARRPLPRRRDRAPGPTASKTVFADDDHPSRPETWSTARARSRRSGARRTPRPAATARVVDQPDPIEIIGELPDPKSGREAMVGCSASAGRGSSAWASASCWSRAGSPRSGGAAGGRSSAPVP